MFISKKFYLYIDLMRLNKPIGIFLVLWPTLWALWLASDGQPDIKILSIFVLGAILMRSAGCILNDIADRNFDKFVARTQARPLATGQISIIKALLLSGCLAFMAFLLILNCNLLTIFLAIAGLGLAIIYPLMKRFTYLPQCGLGLAFSWGVPMAFAATTGKVTTDAWFLFLTAAVWPVIYDSMYAMADREDDIKIGVKSTALLFNQKDKLIIGILQATFVTLLIAVGILFNLNKVYYSALIVVVFLFIYQQKLIKDRHPKKCFQAFLNNNWVGMSIFFGIVGNYFQK